jgi:hypothetical protein
MYGLTWSHDVSAGVDSTETQFSPIISPIKNPWSLYRRECPPSTYSSGMEHHGLNPPRVLAARSDILIGETLCQACGHQCKNVSALARHVNSEHELITIHPLLLNPVESTGRHCLIALEHMVYSCLKLPLYANRPPAQFVKRSVNVPCPAEGFAWLARAFSLSIRWTASGSFIVDAQFAKIEEMLGCVSRQFPGHTASIGDSVPIKLKWAPKVVKDQQTNAVQRELYCLRMSFIVNKTIRARRVPARIRA